MDQCPSECQCDTFAPSRCIRPEGHDGQHDGSGCQWYTEDAT